MMRFWTSFLAALVVTACAVTAAHASEPIKIGFIGPLTGVFAQSGKDMLEGLKLALDGANNEAAGRKIELIAEDDEGNPATALAKYRKLTTHDRIHVLSGVLLSHIGYGLVQPIERDQLPTLFLTTPDDLTKRKPAKWILRANFAASQLMHPLGDYSAKTLKYKRVAAVAMDNPFGHEQIGGFQRVFEDNGGKVVQRLWVPLNVLDFAPYVSQIARDADAVVGVFTAAQAVRFVKQYGEIGPSRKPLLGSGILMDEHALKSMGDEAIGVINALHWSPMLPNAANQTFMKLTEARLGKTPSYFNAIMYSSGRWIVEAARLVGGQVEDKERFVNAIKKASETVEDARGPIKLDDYGNPTENVYILKVERVGGKLVNTVVHTYPMVSQFWTYSAADFLKLPLYTRDYPPVKP
jgi:branched-chain amino acid transport system substrate-binding protein